VGDGLGLAVHNNFNRLCFNRFHESV
jgi:hypothetical protein